MASVAVIGLPVETETGTHLGKVAGVEVDAGTQAVTRYVVSRGNVLTRLVEPLPAELLVDPVQVTALTEEKMVVVDLLAAEPATAAPAAE